MFYCDSNLFIRPAISKGAKAEAATKVLRAMADGKIMGMTSSLAVDEVLWVTWKSSSKDEAIKAVEAVLGLSNLEIVDTSVSDVKRAIELLRRYDLKPRDAIHAACSLNHAIFSIVSDDADFDAVKELKRLSFEDVVSMQRL